MVRDRELAEDLSQETFVKALNAIESYRPEFKFSSWIFKIANNAAIDHLRRRELDTLSLDGSPHAETPEAMQATALQIGARQESPLDAVEARELGGAIEAAIGRLRPEYRSCILLRHVEGHAYEEIAEILDLPLGTVKTYIHRARIALRTICSMTASIVWTPGPQQSLAALGTWLAGEAGRAAWLAVRGVASNFIEQPWYAGLRSLAAHPARLGLASAFASLVYVGGIVALRRLLALPTQGVAHANV